MTALVRAVVSLCVAVVAQGNGVGGDGDFVSLLQTRVTEVPAERELLNQDASVEPEPAPAAELANQMDTRTSADASAMDHPIRAQKAANHAARTAAKHAMKVEAKRAAKLAEASAEEPATTDSVEDWNTLVPDAATTQSVEDWNTVGPDASTVGPEASTVGPRAPASLARFGRNAHSLEYRKNRAKATSKASGAVRLLDFTLAEIIFNNLGGQGPQKLLPSGEPAPKEIRYRNLVKGSAIDLVVTAGAGYKAYNPSRNGVLGGNAQINAKSGTSAHLTFTFVEQGTYTPRVMPHFYMTFSDVDERHGGMEKERISVDSYEKYYTNDDLMIVNDGSPIPTFESSDYGNYEDNEFSPDSPKPTQLSHAVTFLFLNKATFNANFTIEEHRDFNNGRNVLFSGISQLVFCKDPSTYLDFKSSTVSTNNLGGMGPGAGPDELRYSGIATTAEGQVLDLVATANEVYGYNASNTSQNGLHGEFGTINLYCGPTKTASEAYVTFTVVQGGTLEPVVLNQFAFVVFDFDSGLHEQQVEYVDIMPKNAGFEGGKGYASYIVTDTTELAISDLKNGKKRFEATKHGTEADNPTTAQNLAREVSDKSVVFTFRQTASFTITLGITPTGFNTGRNFMFSGQDMYLLCD